MIRWMSAQSRLVGFTYYPAWEIAFGAFLIVCAIGVPALFLRYNGFHAKHYPEWLFCTGFFLFFGWIGKNLVWQSFTAFLDGNDLVVTHNLREPPLHVRRSIAGWTDTVIWPAPDADKPDQSLLVLVSGSDALELHRTVSESEITALHGAFATLRQTALPPAAASPAAGHDRARGEPPFPASAAPFDPAGDRLPDATGNGLLSSSTDATPGVPPGGSINNDTGSTTP